MPTQAERRQRLFEVASSQGGYFKAAHARALGYETSTITHHARTGRFERVSRGFYRLAEFPALPYEDVIAAWVKAGPERAVVSHDAALALYELAPSRSRQIHLTVPWEQRPRHRPALAGVRIHTTKKPLRRDEVVQRFGVRVTAPARTIVDVTEVGVDPSVVIEAVARALDTGLVTADELRKAVGDRSERVRNLIERAIAEAGSHAPVP
ncbi:MAG: type IV toxin-antitoxin system AbiEi family antitoxin domain-containing protein [bacterium]|nr:type IV toxin-antitoxin system AbiEi family antitoxin domain-containing protein [bacterium]